VTGGVPFPPLSVSVDIEQDPWSDIDLATVENAHLIRIGLLRHGTVEGKATVAMLVVTHDGRKIIVQTSWLLFNTAARALAAGPVGSEEV
jgi:hypothetical protein